ncbi:MAG: glycosyltransferase family 4 protein [Anaerolineae bacterium]
MVSVSIWIIYGLVFLVAFGVTFLLTPAAAWLSHRLGAVALPGGRRRHRGAIPRLGGLAVYGGFVLAVLLTLPYPRTAADSFRLAGLLLSCTVIVIGGLLDDRFQLGFLPQLGFTALATLVACRYWVFIERVNNPFTSGQIVFPISLTIILTLLWMTGMSITLNWLDGLDGLTTGVSAIAVLIFFVHMVRTGQQSVALLPAALLGATLGFLPRNWHPARIFLGSCGAYFLGFAVGGLSLIGGARAATALLVLVLPILDVAWLIFDRVRRGRSPAAGDRSHLHFRLVDLGLPQPRIVLVYYALSALFGLMALLIPSRLYKLLALVGLGIIVVGVLAVVSRLSDVRQHAASQEPIQDP